jgi:hypothetical protein
VPPAARDARRSSDPSLGDSKSNSVSKLGADHCADREAHRRFISYSSRADREAHCDADRSADRSADSNANSSANRGRDSITNCGPDRIANCGAHSITNCGPDRIANCGAHSITDSSAYGSFICADTRPEQGSQLRVRPYCSADCVPNIRADGAS